jgi:hypothetical protein
MENASNPQTFRDLNEHRCVVDVNDLPGCRLGDVQGQSKDVNIGLANVNEAGRDERVHKPVELELANAMRIHLAGFVADHDNLESVALLELRDQFNHLGASFRLCEDEAPKLSSREGALLVKDHSTQVFFKRKLAFLMGFEGELVAHLHLSPRQVEGFRCPPPGMMIPSIVEQYISDVQE